jgi:hypothetical protein
MGAFHVGAVFDDTRVELTALCYGLSTDDLLGDVQLLIFSAPLLCYECIVE